MQAGRHSATHAEPGGATIAPPRGDLHAVAAAVSLTVAGVGLLVLAGWALDIAMVRDSRPATANMKPNTALGLIAASASLWLQRREGMPHRGAARLLAAAVLALGALTLLETAGGVDFGIDRLLFDDPTTAPGVPPGRMATGTAICFAMVGAALYWLDLRVAGVWVAQALLLLPGPAAFLALVGYAYGVEAFYSARPWSTMALHTAASFVLLSIGGLCARPQRGVVGIATSRGAGGYMARRLLPVAVLVPWVLGGLCLIAARRGGYGAGVDVGLFTVSTVIILVALVLWNAAMLRRLDAERLAATQETRRLNAELELRVAERTAALEAANRDLEAFGYSVSHDLRAPLRSIDGFSHALLEDYGEQLDSNGRGFLRRIRGGAQRMSELIDDFQALARIGRGAMRREPVNLSNVARAVAGELRREAPQRQVALTVADGLIAHADPHLLRVVLANLLGNAWKYTATRPIARVEVGGTADGGEPVFFVRDDGVGFDMRYADQLFRPFHRLHGDEFDGSGIGLATVQRIIQRHGGRVWADGAPDRGATIYFTIPPR